MDSSDEELFEVMPSTSTSNTSSEWIVEKNDTSMQSSFKKNVSSDYVPTKNISLKLTRLFGVKSMKKQISEKNMIQLKNRKRIYRRNRWRHGDYKKRTLVKKRLRTRKESKETAAIVEAPLESLENKVSDDAYIHCHKETNKVTEQFHTASENSQNTENDFILSTNEVQDEKENSCNSGTDVCARILPYKFHQRWKEISNTTDTIMHSDISFSNTDTAEQDTYNNNSEHNRSLTEAQVIEDLFAKKSELMDIDNSQKQLQKRRMSVSDDELPTRKIRRRRISSSSSNSSNNIITTASSTTTISDDNSTEFYSFHEDMKQEASCGPNMRFNRELQVVLNRLEDMNDADVIKWRESRMQNASEVVSKPQIKTEQSDKQKVVNCNNEKMTLRRRNDIRNWFGDYLTAKRRSFINSLQRSELIFREEELNELLFLESSTLEAINVSENSSEVLILSTKNAKKFFPSNELNNLLDTQMLQKKYKLFKKPRVLLIKLEYLKHSFEDGKYSAIEINHLTGKYINNVIKSISLPVAQIEDESSNMNPSTSSEQNMNRSYEQMSTEENFARDTGVIENNSDENAPFKIRRNIYAFTSQNKSAEILKKKKKFPQQTLVQIWRNAFGVKLTEKPQKSIAKQSTSTQSLSKTPSDSQSLPKKSIETPSVSPSSPKKSTDIGCKSTSSSFALSSKNKKMPVIHNPSKKYAEAEVMLTKYNETSKNDIQPVVSDYANLPSNMSVEKIVSKNDVLQSNNNVVSKNPCKDIIDKVTVDSSSNLLNSPKSRKFGFYVEREASDSALSKSPEKSNLESSNDKTLVKSKTLIMQDHQSSYRKRQIMYKCIICTMPFENYQLLLKHITNSSCKVGAKKSSTNNTSELDSQLSFINEIYNSESPNPSTSQQHSTVNEEDDSLRFNRSLTNFDKESSSSSTPTNKKLRRKFWTPPSKVKPKLLRKSQSADFDFQNRTNILKSKSFEDYYKQLNCANEITCKVCSQTFKSYSQLSKHIFHHTARDLQNAYLAPKYKNIFINQRTNDNNDQVSKETTKNSTVEGMVKGTAKESIDLTRNNVVEQANTPLENATESNSGFAVSMQISERNAIEKKNNTQNLLETECIENAKIQSTSAKSNKMTKKIECMEKNKVPDTAVFPIKPNVSVEPQSPKHINICKCHNTKTVDENNIYIEIVVLCEICQTLFRRFECFESHFQHHMKDSTCVKDRKRGRVIRLLCNACYKVLDSVQDILPHLKSHVQPNRKVIAGFRCNICKVIFYGFGNMFKNHIHNHVKNLFFLASRLSFPQFSYIGSTLSKMPTINNPNLLEIYMQVADYLCRKCKKVFPTEEVMKLHDASCQNNAAVITAPTAGVDDVGSSHSTASGKSGSSSSSEKMQILQICGFCNKTFYNRASFELHSLEHKQKRQLYPHYIFVSVTAVTKIYICKVCTTVCETLQKFEEHWSTHGTLQEDYVCSHCQNHYDTFDLFKQHAITHKNADEKQQEPISCKVIYRDVRDQSPKTSNSQEHAVIDGSNLLSTNLDYLEGKEATSDKSYNNVEVPSTTDNQQLVKIGAIMSSCVSHFLAHKDTQNVRENVDNSNIPEKISLTNTMTAAQSKRAMTNDNEICTTDYRPETEVANKNTEEEMEDEVDMVIEISESEESSVSSKIRQKTDAAQKSTMASDSAIVSYGERCPNDMTPSSTKTSNDANPSSSAKTNVIPARESVIESNTNMTQPKSLSKKCSGETSVADKNAVNIPMTTTTTPIEINCANKKSSTNSLTTSNINPIASKSKESLPENVMSALPKSFLRVKSLAELMNVSPEYRCKNDQTSSTNKSQKLLPKPQFDPSMRVPTTIQNQFRQPIGNATPLSVRSRPSNRVINNTTNSQYQVIGIKPLNRVSCNIKVANNAVKANETPQYGMTWVPLSNNSTVQPQSQQTLQQFQQVPQQKLLPQQNLPSYITQPNKIVQPIHQQQQQQLQQLQQQQKQQLQQQQQQKQQLLQQQQKQQLQQQQQQQQLQQQQQQQQLQQQQQQQSASTVTVRPFMQTNMYQTPLMTYLPPQQQPIDVGNPFLFNYMLPKECVPYQLPANNIMPANPINKNIPVMNTMMLQMSQNPELYTCICCPGFECNSVQQFTLHERSPKHEARSRYNGVSYVPR